MPDGFEIRPLSYADLSAAIEIERRSFPAPWSLAMFALELAKPSSVCLAAVESGEVIGYAICSRYDTAWHVMNIAVDSQHRRRGVAAALIEGLLVEIGDASYTLEVRQSNAAAIALYTRYGFEVAGVRRRYYSDNGEDALIMWRRAEVADAVEEGLLGALRDSRS